MTAHWISSALTIWVVAQVPRWCAFPGMKIGMDAEHQVRTAVLLHGLQTVLLYHRGDCSIDVDLAGNVSDDVFVTLLYD
ncbi:hypothetical protein F5146DRAFT_1145719 [Armillaria mellea]|nr:hypothetical protein F5146DRAFT_1145719 [Armillaria mellea]